MFSAVSFDVSISLGRLECSVGGRSSSFPFVRGWLRTHPPFEPAPKPDRDCQLRALHSTGTAQQHRREVGTKKRPEPTGKISGVNLCSFLVGACASTRYRDL